MLTCSDIVADVAFHAALDVKKSELHGMSQRGGSVSSDVRYGPHVFSPMVPPGEGDFLVATAADQVPVNAAALREGGTVIDPSHIDESKLRNKKSQCRPARRLEPAPAVLRAGVAGGDPAHFCPKPCTKPICKPSSWAGVPSRGA